MDFHDKTRVIVMKTYFSLSYFLVALFVFLKYFN